MTLTWILPVIPRPAWKRRIFSLASAGWQTAYDADYRITLQRTNLYRLSLYCLCIVLLVCIGYTFRALHLANERLEQRVAALEKLEKLDSRKADVVRLRVFWGLKIGEIAASLGVGRATVDRDWQFARAWLKEEVTEDR